MAGSLDRATLHRLYRSGVLHPAAVIDAVYSRMAARGDDHVWISLIPRQAALARAAQLHARHVSQDSLPPLWGLPFAIKDNIDLSGVPTTAACPAYAYIPERSATVVERLTAVGAIAIGKTNLDQFATGLVGVRSPYGVPRNPFDSAYIPGGSSSGSAVAVATGGVSFALGTDTAGSGRIPAAFCNVVGLKPTRGLIPTAGVVPACRSLDCVSIFALTGEDAAAVLSVAAGPDPHDPYSRVPPPQSMTPDIAAGFRFGIPTHLECFGDGETAQLFGEAVKRLEAIGGRGVAIEFAPFAEAGRLLYDGPWVAERLAAIEAFLAKSPEALHPITRQIIEGGATFSAVDTFRALYTLEGLRARTQAVWDRIACLIVPTAPTIYRIETVEADPIRLNTQLGIYTNFVNLLDLAAIAVPSGFRPDGIPTGITLIAPAFHDDLLIGIAAEFQRRSGLRLGATTHVLSPLPLRA
ncbi:MAG: allophanate hydrolase [Nitrospinae bacterium]|nr:allophanate hydrolase [Nitrospinota bacterium]